MQFAFFDNMLCELYARSMLFTICTQFVYYAFVWLKCVTHVFANTHYFDIQTNIKTHITNSKPCKKSKPQDPDKKSYKRSKYTKPKRFYSNRIDNKWNLNELRVSKYTLTYAKKKKSKKK